jgi:hypothetical protein
MSGGELDAAYERDAERRRLAHEELWAEEPLNWWQRLMLGEEQEALA